MVDDSETSSLDFYRQASFGFSFNFIATVITVILQFATTVLLVRLLSIQDYGIYSLLFASVAFFGIVSGLVIPMISRFLPAWIEHKKYFLAKKAAGIAIAYSFAVGIAVLLAMLFFPNIFNVLFKGNFLQAYALLFGVFMVFNLPVVALDVTLTALLEQKTRNIARICYAILVLLLSFIALKSGFGLAGVLTAVLASTIVVFVLTFAKTRALLFSKKSSGERKFEIKRILKYSFFNHLLYVGDLFVNLNIDIILIGAFIGAGASGLYAFAARIPQTLVFYSPAVVGTAMLFPFIVKKFSKTQSKEQLSYFFELYTRFTAFFTIPIAIASIILAPEIISFVFSAKYLSGIAVFYIATLTFTIVSFRYSILTIYNTIEKPQIGLYARLVFIASTLANIFLLMMGKGITVVMIVSGIAMVLMVLIEYLLTSKHVILKMPWKGFSIVIANSAITAILLLFLKGFASSLAMLLAIVLISTLFYCLISVANKPFSERDTELFARAGRIGRFFGILGRKA